MRGLLAASSLVLFAIGALGLPGRQSTPIEKIQGYRTWYCDTPKALDMDARFAAYCAPPILPIDPIDPHERFLFKIWTNPVAKAAFLSKKSVPFPVGSIVVKEKYSMKGTKTDAYGTHQLTRDAKPVLLTAMVKRDAGYDRVNGDWEYLALKGDVTKQTTSGLEHCAQCHLSAKGRDFVFKRRCEDGGPNEHPTPLRRFGG